MYELKRIGRDKYVGIIRTGAGYKVATWKIMSRNKLYIYRSVNTETLATARKVFKLQKPIHK